MAGFAEQDDTPLTFISDNVWNTSDISDKGVKRFTWLFFLYAAKKCTILNLKRIKETLSIQGFIHNLHGFLFGCKLKFNYSAWSLSFQLFILVLFNEK